jgi:uncharacterized protein (DUF2384 family)
MIVPKMYEEIKESYLKRGESPAKAKEIAARTYNKRRKPGQKPVTGKHGARKK